jgi:hypothetical protein
MDFRTYGSCCRCRKLTSPEASLLMLGYPDPQQLLEAWGTKSLDSRNSGAFFLGMGSRKVVQ